MLEIIIFLVIVVVLAVLYGGGAKTKTAETLAGILIPANHPPKKTRVRFAETATEATFAKSNGEIIDVKTVATAPPAAT